MGGQMQVAFAASRNLYPYLGPCYVSLLEHNPDAKVWFFIEDDRLPYETPENIEFVNCSKQTVFGADCVNAKTSYTYLSMLRGAYPMLFNGKDNGCGIRPLPKLDKLISLDVDVIVRESLRPLWEIDMDEAYMCACEETLGSYKPFGKDKPYWNFGVAVMGLEAMRRDGMDAEVIRLLNEVKLRQIDQDAMAKICSDNPGKALPMGPKWNEHFLVTQSLNPKIVHFAGCPDWYENPDLERGAYLEPYKQYYRVEECRRAGIKC